MQNYLINAKQNLMDAVNGVEDGLSYRQASLKYRVPRSTIYDHSRVINMKRSGPALLLNENEEAALVRWITRSSSKGCPKRRSEIMDAAHILLKRRLSVIEKKRPGQSWFYNFIRRHKLSLRKSETLSKASACISKPNIESWFKKVYDYLSGRDFVGDIDYRSVLSDPSRCYNADESFFLLNPVSGKVVAPRGTRNVFEIKNGSDKEGLTVMACFGADGDVVAPQIIFGYERVPAAIRTAFPPSLHLGFSKKGWMNSQLFIEFIKNVFHPHIVQKHGLDVPVILYVDGHPSHLTIEATDLCESLNIILIQLYPNSTYLIQPADVSCFKSLKAIWRNVVSEYRGTDVDQSVTKIVFGSLILKTFERFNPQTAINGFHACGLFPWDHSNIDFTKCLGKVYQNDVVEDLVISNNTVDSHLNLERLEEILGANIVNNFKHASEPCLDPSDFQIVYSKLKSIYDFVRNQTTLNTTVDFVEPVCNDLYQSTFYDDYLHFDDMEDMLIDNIESIYSQVNVSTEDNVEETDLVVSVSTEDNVEETVLVVNTPLLSPDRSLNRYAYDDILPQPRTPQRLNKRMLKEKPHFVLTSKPEMARKKMKIEEKREQEIAKRERVLLRQQKKIQKTEDILVKKKLKAEAKLRKAQAAFDNFKIKKSPETKQKSQK